MPRSLFFFFWRFEFHRKQPMISTIIVIHSSSYFVLLEVLHCQCLVSTNVCLCTDNMSTAITWQQHTYLLGRCFVVAQVLLLFWRSGSDKRGERAGHTRREHSRTTTKPNTKHTRCKSDTNIHFIGLHLQQWKLTQETLSAFIHQHVNMSTKQYNRLYKNVQRMRLSLNQQRQAQATEFI